LMFLRQFSAELTLPLSLMYDFSLNCTFIPQSWTEANVTVLYKGKGPRSDPNSYRDISICNTFVKPLEILINKALVNHCNTVSIFGSEQHAFLKQRSTVTNLFSVFEDWVNTIDAGGFVEVIYLDLKKAFNSISHSKLLAKLFAVGVQGKLLLWLRNFLLNRRQRVKVNDAISDWERVPSGVPQGSVLGPTLFIIYISDLPNAVTRSCISLYADDTKLYFGFKKDSLAMPNLLQDDLTAVAAWIVNRQLSLSLPKCTVLHCGNNNPNTFYFLNDLQLENVNTMRDLGVIMSWDLKPSEHIKTICRKTTYVVNSILYNFSIVDPHFKVKLFNIYARPRLEYCSQIWNLSAIGDILALEAVQSNFTGKLLGRHISYRNRLQQLKLVISGSKT
jgi:ribonuclease P/MRP protein subunit RPP40